MDKKEFKFDWEFIKDKQIKIIDTSLIKDGYSEEDKIKYADNSGFSNSVIVMDNDGNIWQAFNNK